jgi:hypothetical protein
MRHKTPRSLPSLARPIIPYSERGVGKDEDDAHRPPYPDINLNMAGGTLSHLHWVCIKVTNPILSQEEVRRVETPLFIALLHEFCHKVLALTPFSQLRQYDLRVQSSSAIT